MLIIYLRLYAYPGEVWDTPFRSPERDNGFHASASGLAVPQVRMLGDSAGLQDAAVFRADAFDIVVNKLPVFLCLPYLR